MCCVLFVVRCLRSVACCVLCVAVWLLFADCLLFDVCCLVLSVVYCGVLFVVV